MLKLNHQREPEWLGSIPSNDPANDPRPFLLPGVRVRFRPIGPKAYRAAQQACAEAWATDPEDNEEASDALSREIVRGGIDAWEGIGDPDGEPVEPTAETIALFIATPEAFVAAQQVYVNPYLLRNVEKNGSGASPAGTGEGETPETDIATSSAGSTDENDAPAAPTGQANRSPKKAKRSGR